MPHLMLLQRFHPRPHDDQTDSHVQPEIIRLLKGEGIMNVDSHWNFVGSDVVSGLHGKLRYMDKGKQNRGIATFVLAFLCRSTALPSVA